MLQRYTFVYIYIHLSLSNPCIFYDLLTYKAPPTTEARKPHLVPLPPIIFTVYMNYNIPNLLYYTHQINKLTLDSSALSMYVATPPTVTLSSNSSFFTPITSIDI